MTKLLSGVLVGLALVAVTGAAEAGNYNYDQKVARKALRDVPVKDCTKYNGRWGYYGNPYCTPEEQERFDRWEARNLYR